MPFRQLFDSFLEYIKTVDALSKFASWIIAGISGIIVLSYQYPLISAIMVPICILIIFSLILILMFQQKHTLSKQYKLYIKSTNKILQIWLGDSVSYAAYESSMFEHLFLYTSAGLSDEAACQQAEKCIVDILNRTAQTFKIITGDDCAVTIKWAIRDDDALQTIYRDDSSATLRGTLRDEHSSRLSDNTSMIEVAMGSKSIYINDDLKASSVTGSYKNSRPDWKKYYNAEIIYPIKIHANKRRASSTTEMSGLSSKVFLLGVDNMKGNFHQEISYKIIAYISNRLSAMLYRAEALKLRSSMKQHKS